MKHIWLFGANGYIGSTVAALLVKRQINFIAWDRRIGRSIDGYHQVTADVRNTSVVRDMLDRVPPSVIVDLTYDLQSCSELLQTERNDQFDFCDWTQTCAAKVPVVFVSSATVKALASRANVNNNCAKMSLQEWYRTMKIKREQILLRSVERLVRLRLHNVGGKIAVIHVGADMRANRESLVSRAARHVIATEKRVFSVFGTKYETRDGTCIRDFVHVLDVADAIVRACEYLLDDGQSAVMDIGTGVGITVREFLTVISSCAGRALITQSCAVRFGDVPVSIADTSKALALLHWRAKYSLERIVRDELDAVIKEIGANYLPSCLSLAPAS